MSKRGQSETSQVLIHPEIKQKVCHPLWPNISNFCILACSFSPDIFDGGHSLWNNYYSPHFLVGKGRAREVKLLTQDHTARTPSPEIPYKTFFFPSGLEIFSWKNNPPFLVGSVSTSLALSPFFLCTSQPTHYWWWWRGGVITLSQGVRILFFFSWFQLLHMLGTED